MWDLRVAPPFGRLSIRKFLLWAAATLAVSLAYVLLAAPVTHAADAEWSGSSIKYQNNQYIGPSTLPEGNTSGLPGDTQVYTWSEPNTDGNNAQKVHIIYFDPGADATKATSAKYVEYLFTPPNSYTNKANEKTISLDPTTYGKEATQCAVTGVGWIVCSVSKFLAEGMDNVFGILKTFIEVKPTAFSQKGDLYTAWNVMRGFANVVFIIGFLVVIYSQVTNIGLSNYSIKKMLPRLIAAAILVNVSYYICAIGIDLSNIIGLSLQDLFTNLRTNLFHVYNNSFGDALNFGSITAFILSAGTVGAIGGLTALSATGGTVLGAVYALVPLLVGLFLIILVVLIILAARQALIVLLVIISPLAFVARLLPGTEKWAKKWDDTFIAMLVFFPIFSGIFGGAQLAGSIIIQNATSIIMILFGMAVQIAPLAVIPFILKLSTGLLGRIAGMVNNPRKGVMDRTKNWANDHQEKHKNRGIGGDLKGRNFMRRAARKREMGKRNLARDTERWKQGFESYAAQKTATDKVRQKVELELEISKLKTDTWQAQTKRAINEFRAGNTTAFAALQAQGPEEGPISNMFQRARDSKDNIIDRANSAINRPTKYDSVAMSALSAAAVAADQESRVVNQAIHAAEHQQQHHFATALEASATLRQRAGGIDPHGAVKAEAAAMAEIDKASNTVVETGVTLLNARALRQGTTAKDLSGKMLTDAMSGATIDPVMLEAALDYQAKDGQVLNLEKARMDTHIDQEMLSRVFARNAGTLKQKGGFHLQADPSLANVTIDVMDKSRMGSLGDTPAANIKDLKMGWVQYLSEKANISRIISNSTQTDMQKAYDNVYEAIHNEQIRATIGDRLSQIQEIELALRNQGFKASPKTK